MCRHCFLSWLFDFLFPLACIRHSAGTRSVPATLPACFADPGDCSLVGQLLKANPADAELAVHGTGPPAQFAAAAETRRELGRQLRFGDLGFTGHCGSAFSNVMRCYLPLPLGSSTAWNGMPSNVSSSRDSSLLEFVITIAMFMPCTRVNLSGLSSGNTNCSESPML